MKWFFALHDQAPHFDAYAQMIQVAVLSARENTTLQPHFLYDGAPNALTRWLEHQGVTILPCRTQFYADLERLSERLGPHVMHYGPGVFLRVEIPLICQREGWTDPDVLYTDCDVLFTGDPSPLWPDLFGHSFAVGPENDPNDLQTINSGVMLMRVHALQAVAEPFAHFIREVLPECIERSWDQWAYQEFFRAGWKPMRPELNWKPYWGLNPAAPIVHFHGPKPFLRPSLQAGTALPVQTRLASPSFYQYCATWDDFLRRA